RVEVGAVAVEEVVRLHRAEDVEVPRRSAAQARLALIGETNAGAVLDALGDVDAEFAVLLTAALATAIGAGLLENLATALADRAGALDGEEALCGAHLAVAGAVLAGRHAGAGLGAGAVAGVAADQRRHVDLDGAAEIGLLERDFEIVAQVGAAQARLLAPAALAAAHEVAEDVLEDVGHGRGEFGPEAAPATPAHAAILEGGVAEAVIGGALLGVLQRVVGLVDFLEFVLRVGVPGIAVGMIFHRQLAIGPLEGRLVGALGHAEHI